MSTLRRDWSVFGAMVHKNLLVTFRYVLNIASRLLMMFVMMPLYVLALASFSDGGLQGLLGSVDGRRLSGAIVYGCIVLQFTSDAIWIVGYQIREEQVEGTLEALFVTPSRRWLYMLSRLVEPFTLAGLNALVVLSLGFWAFGAPTLGNVLIALYALVGAVTGIAGVALLIAALALTYLESVHIVAAVCNMLLMVLCGMVAPFSALPDWLQTASRAVPLSYAVDLFRSSLIGFPPGYPELASVGSEMVLTALWAIVLLPLGLWSIEWAEQRTRRFGSLERF